MKKITIYTGPMCNYCDAAKRLLIRNNATYNEIDISKVDGAMDEMIKKANGKRTIPQIFFDDQHIGGYDEDFIYAQDYKLFVDLVRNGSKFKNINKVLYKLNTTNNISVNKKDIQGYYADCVKNNLRPDGRR